MNYTESIQYFNGINIKMTTTFMISENSMISDRCRLRLNLVNKMDLKRDDNCLALSELSIYTHRRI